MDPRLFYSLQAALLFLIVSSPVMYNLVQMVFGRLFTVAVKGCPTVSGLLLHTVVFALLTYLLMVYQAKTEGFVSKKSKNYEAVMKSKKEREEKKPVKGQPVESIKQD